jgi:hypothetical protein
MFGLVTTKRYEKDIEQIEDLIKEICPHKKVRKKYTTGFDGGRPYYKCEVCKKWLFNNDKLKGKILITDNVETIMK